MTAITELLEKVPLFHGLSEEHVARICGLLRRERFEDDQILIRQGDSSGALLLILEGTAKVVYPGQGSELEVARLTRGGHVGEMSLLNGQPRNATVRAVGEVEVGVLDRAAFRELGRQTPGLAMEILEALSVRMRGADEHISMLSDMAMRDPLTSLLNRRAFNDRIKQEADRARRYKTEFSLLLFDIDRFKLVNDTLGHDAGDSVLHWVGRLLAEHTRASDTPFRIGGEEFAVLCPSTGADTAPVAAHRLVRLVAESEPPVEGLRITLSGGHSSCPDHGFTFEPLYRIADQALLRAKSTGRNQVGEPRLSDAPRE